MYTPKGRSTYTPNFVVWYISKIMIKYLSGIRALKRHIYVRGIKTLETVCVPCVEIVMVTSVKRSPKLRTNAVRQWLCTARRLAVERGVHVVMVRTGGKCSIQDALAFFGNCPELANNVQIVKGGHQIILSIVK